MFYWRNDTPSFFTWRRRLATAPDTPTCIVIHGGQSTGGVHPLNQFVHEIVGLLPSSSELVHHTFITIICFQRSNSFIGSLDKSHTRVFNALICLCKCVPILTRAGAFAFSSFHCKGLFGLKLGYNFGYIYSVSIHRLFIFFSCRLLTSFGRRCMCWLLTFFLVLIQNKLRVICY